MSSDIKTKSTTAKQSKAKSRNKRVLIWVVSIATALLIVDLSSGLVSYGVMFARCGQAPVIASDFMAGYSYKVPGQSGYGPNALNRIYFCSTQDAERAGFQRAS